jgi:pyruvate formate lyase activating enzyme
MSYDRRRVECAAGTSGIRGGRNLKGIITDIQRFSIHDGPGIRSTVFFKGCNMRCAWCHNPETLEMDPQLEAFPDRCIGCGDCVTVCRVDAIALEGGKAKVSYERCTACGDCAKICCAEALVMVGKATTAEEVLREVNQDRPYYLDSGGGVTLSGGECFFQKDFAYELLSLCKDGGIHTAIETNMAMPWGEIEPLWPVVDLVMMDIKIMDEALHREWTGVSNRGILENARLLAATGKPLIVRTPVIPGVNDNREEIGAIATFISGFAALRYYELLPYNPLGTDKYRRLGMDYGMAEMRRPPKDKMLELAQVAKGKGARVVTDDVATPSDGRTMS